MSLKSKFKGVYPLSWCYAYDREVDQSFMELEEQRFLQIAEDLNIPVLGISRTQKGFDFGFNSIDDHNRFIEAAFGLGHEKIYNFEYAANLHGATSQSFKTWFGALVDSARHADIRCIIKVSGNEISVWFDNEIDFDLFTDLMNEGVVDSLAESRTIQQTIGYLHS
jgi:hypothetical protein